MIRTLLLLLVTFCYSSVFAQNNILLFQKHDKTVKTFFQGKYIAFDTKQGSSATGIITKIGKDTIYIRHFEIVATGTEYGGVYFDTSYRHTTAIHVKDIGALHPFKDRTAMRNSGTILMMAGGGVMVLGAVNGIYRKESIRDWYKPSGYISAVALAGTGFILKKISKKKFVIGRKYQLKILSIN